MNLHIVNKPALSHSCLDECLAVCQVGDSILLIEDAVLSANCLSPEQLQHIRQLNIKMHALEADVAARGMSDQIPEHVQLVDDEGFVSLTIEHPKSISWF